MASQIPTFQNLFGSTSYFSVPSSRSVLSPAAYFVDLMNLVANHITAAQGDGKTLHERRNDLFSTLVLDKKNTDTIVSKLSIVNTVLQNNLGDSSLSNNYPLTLPYSHSLHQIRTYLGQHKTNLQNLWQTLLPTGTVTSDQGKAIALETLELSLDTWNICSTPCTSATVYPLYGLTADNTANLGDVSTFLNQTGLKHDQLVDLIYQDLSQTEVDLTAPPQENFFINSNTSGPSSTPPLAVDGQSITNLVTNGNSDITRLDRVNRFVRMAMHLKWSFADLDWALQTIGKIVNTGAQNGTPIIDDKILPYLAWIQHCIKTRELTVNQCCGMLGTLKDYGQKDRQDFFNSVFCNPDNPLPSGYATKTLQDVASSKSLLDVLAASLHVSSEDMVAIVNLASASLKPTTPLTPQTLGILYRLSLLPKITGLSVKETLLAWNLISTPSTNMALAGSADEATLAALIALETFASWLQSSPFSIYQLQFILTGKSDAPAVQNAILATDAITNFLKDLAGLIEKISLTTDKFYHAIKEDLNKTLSAVINASSLTSGAQYLSDLSHYSQEVAKQLYNSLNAAFGTRFYAGVNTDGVYSLENGQWMQMPGLMANSSASVMCLCEYEGSLYAGDAYGSGIWQLNSSGDWVLFNHGLSLGDTQVFCLETYDGILYAGVTSASTNASNGLYALQNGTWVQQTNGIDNTGSIRCLYEFNGTFYAALNGNGLYALNNYHNTWEKTGDGLPANPNCRCLYNFNGTLYLGLYGSQGLYKLNNQTQTWQQQTNGLSATSTNIRCLYAFNGSLYAGADAGIYVLDATGKWTQQTSEAVHIECFYVIDDVFYAATNGGTNYSLAGNLWTAVPQGNPTAHCLYAVCAFNRSTTKYISGDGVVLTANAGDGASQSAMTANLANIIGKIIPKVDVSFSAETLAPLVAVIAAVLQRHYTLQQETFSKNLASLFGLSPRLGPVLKTIGDLSIRKLVGNELKAHLLDAVKPASANVVAQDVARALPTLQKLQQSAALIGALSLSSAEAAYLDIQYPVTLESVQNAHQLRQLVVLYQDANNNLLNILAAAPGSDQMGNIAQLTGVKRSEVQALMLNIGIPRSGDALSVIEVALLQAHFSACEALSIGADDLIGLKTLANIGSASAASNQSNMARALWAGLQRQYGGQPSILAKIEGGLSEQLRDHLVPLAMQNLGLDTPRALYEYLLIDVEVSSNVQTSPLVEGISAVQLYIYRCLNQLEPDVSVDPVLPDLWTWMYAYREWQANKEVLLYPEDYIQPELRKNKTEIFAEAEAKLKQIDLTNPDGVVGVFQEYMNRFVDVANLRIVGCAARDLRDSGTNLKELCFIAVTKHDPQHYYWRTAKFDQSDQNGYQPVCWGQWGKFNIHIKPVEYEPGTYGTPTPVFAFGKWYVFWIEQAQSSAKSKQITVNQGFSSSPDKEYTAKVSYSYLDFSKRWVAPQTLASVDLGTTPITQQQNSVGYPVYTAATQTLYVSFDGCAYSLTENETLSTQITWISSAWFRVDDENRTGLIGNIAIQAGQTILVNGVALGQGPVIQSDTWYRCDVLSTGDVYINGSPVFNDVDLLTIYIGNGLGSLCSYTPSNGPASAESSYHYNTYSSGMPESVFSCFCAFEGIMYAGTIGGSLGAKPSGLLAYIGTKWTPIAATNAVPTNDTVRGSCVFDGKLYVGTDQSGLRIFDGSTWQAPGETNGLPALGEWIYCFAEFQGQLYMGVGSCGLYVYDGTSWSQINTAGAPATNDTVHALYVFGGELYVGTYQSGLRIFDGASWEAPGETKGLPPTNYWILCFTEFQGQLYMGMGSYGLFVYNGTSWSKINAPNAPESGATVGALTVLNDSILFAGTDTNSPLCIFDGTTWVSPYNSYYCSAFATWSHSFSNYFAGDIQQFSSFDEVQDGKQRQEFAPPHLIENSFSSNPDILPVLGPPDWNIILKNGAEYLSIPYQASAGTQLRCYRLNSTAARALSVALHEPGGVDSLLAISTQRSPEISFSNIGPNNNIVPPANYPLGQIDFTQASAMSNYYWEIFFHLPFLIANELLTHQQFAEAKNWLEYIFNPTVCPGENDLNANDTQANDRFWRFLGLRTYNNPLLAQELSESYLKELTSDLNNPEQLNESNTDPFDPHAIAALRPIAYQKTVVTHYIDVLLAWGDMLYRENTRESINEAEMLYVEAYDLLGKEPTDLGPEKLSPSATYGNMTKNAVGEYFGIPRNQQFLAYWAEVRNRLYNIRQGLTIDGQVDKLPLFQPPINPMALVSAVASGEGITQAIGSLTSVVPYYRFDVILQKSKDVTHSVIQLGQSLLSALEKQDAEKLAILYNTNRQNILELTRASKHDQLQAAQAGLLALQATLAGAQKRLSHYTGLIAAGLSSSEQQQLRLGKNAIDVQVVAEAIKAASIVGYAAPCIFGFSDGGMKFGDAVNQGAAIAEGIGNLQNLASNLAGSVASYQRRLQDWQLQASIAQDDINQVQQQIIAAQYRQDLAQQDVALLENDIKQNRSVADFYFRKFTNAQLYQWYVGQIAALYFQAYGLAHDLAMQAKNAWQYEQLGRSSATQTSQLIKPGYWNSLYQGLLAGEALLLDLQRMEKTYFDQNQRQLEIVKTISLAQLDPKALLDLKQNGTCTFDITEADFDFDFPGHYCRRIKTVSISLPLIVGPYQNVHATLTQLSNKTVISDDSDGQAAVTYLLTGTGSPTPALKSDLNPNQQVALSRGINDVGLFELNFNDQRYLPFEGTGAVSSWQLEMPPNDNAIDFGSLTDAIIEMQYTALPGNNGFRSNTIKNRGGFCGYRMISLAETYAAAWQKFLQDGVLSFSANPATWRQGASSFHISKIGLYGQGAAGSVTYPFGLSFPTSVNQQQVADYTASIPAFSSASPYTSLPLSSKAMPSGQPLVPDTYEWTLTYGTDTPYTVPPETLENLFLIIEYTAQ